jgi:LacI family transcriptional regulator
MARRKGVGRGSTGVAQDGGRAATLRDVADYLQLSPATVSVVLNRAPVAESIPAETQARVFAAAQKLNYRPNLLARSLRNQRTFSVGVLLPEIIDGYATLVLGGIERHLLREGWFFLVASHRSKTDLLDEYLEMFRARLVEGYILVNTPLAGPPTLPTVTVSGHEQIDGVTNVLIDHDRAAELALTHLAALGHERIAFFKGHPGSTDTEERWRAINDAARKLGLPVRRELTLQLRGDGPGPKFKPEEGLVEGYTFGKMLLERGAHFTALFGFNDTSAIGAMRAFLDAGLKVPEQISVVGFDDIVSAEYQNPSLTTVRQPLKDMGETAARLLLERLSGNGKQSPAFLTVEPELVVRGSTGPAPAAARQPAARRGPGRPRGGRRTAA